MSGEEKPPGDFPGGDAGADGEGENAASKADILGEEGEVRAGAAEERDLAAEEEKLGGGGGGGEEEEEGGEAAVETEGGGKEEEVGGGGGGGDGGGRGGGESLAVEGGAEPDGVVESAADAGDSARREGEGVVDAVGNDDKGDDKGIGSHAEVADDDVTTGEGSSQKEAGDAGGGGEVAEDAEVQGEAEEKNEEVADEEKGGEDVGGGEQDGSREADGTAREGQGDVEGEQQRVAAAAAAAAGGEKESGGGAPIGLTGWGARKLWKVPTAASPVGLSATCCRRLFEPPSACALDTSRSRLLCADGYGIYGCRSSTLIDAECDVDCRTEGYSSFATHVRSVRLIDVCPGGRYIATASSLDESMCILHECDALTGRRLSVARAYECPGGGRIEALRFSACATALAIGTHDHKVHVCMLADGKHLAPLLHDSPVCDIRTAVLLSNVGGLVSVCKDGSVWLWGLDRSRLLCVMRPHSTLKGSTKQTWAGHIGSILAADIRGGTMVTSGVDGTCKVWGLGLVMAGNAKNAQRQLGMRTEPNPIP
jgi:hypothetical protein